MTRTNTLASFPLPESQAGDVLAARSCAEGFLHQAAAATPLLGQARLVLTAACLHLQARLGPLPELRDLHSLLTRLAENDVELRGAMAGSTLQIVQYVARDFPGDDDKGLPAISLAIQAVTARLHTIVL